MAAVHVGLGRVGDLAEHLFGGRIDVGEGPRLAVDELAVDQHPRLEPNFGRRRHSGCNLSGEDRPSLAIGSHYCLACENVAIDIVESPYTARGRVAVRPRSEAWPVQPTPQPPVHLKSARLLDVDKGTLVEPGELLVDGERIVEVGPTSVPADSVTIDLGDLTLLPGLMDMEVNLLLGGPDHTSPLNPVQDDPALRTLRAVANARRTLRSGFTTVRNLGLFVQTGGILLDVALKKAIDFGWIDGPRVVPAGHAITPTGGHLDPTMFQALAPHVMPLTVEEGIANGVSEVRRAVRYQIKYGAELIKVCASGGVMSHTGPAGAQQYSDEELRAIVDEAHRRGLKVAAHAHGDDGIRAAIEAGIDCIEHGSLMSDETLDLLVERGTFLVPTTYLADGMDVSHAAPELQAQGGRGLPPCQGDHQQGGRPWGARIACGTDAPAIPHGRNAKELVALVDRGMSPLDAIRAATTVVRRADRRRRPRPPRPGPARRRGRRAGRSVGRHRRDRGGAVRDEGRSGLPPRRRARTLIRRWISTPSERPSTGGSTNHADALAPGFEGSDPSTNRSPSSGR